MGTTILDGTKRIMRSSARQTMAIDYIKSHPGQSVIVRVGNTADAMNLYLEAYKHPDYEIGLIRPHDKFRGVVCGVSFAPKGRDRK